MKNLIFLSLFISLTAISVEQPSKEEMSQNLRRYVKENKEASVSIAPLIEKLTSILDGQEAKKKANDAAAKKEVDSLFLNR